MEQNVRVVALMPVRISASVTLSPGGVGHMPRAAAFAAQQSRRVKILGPKSATPEFVWAKLFRRVVVDDASRVPGDSVLLEKDRARAFFELGYAEPCESPYSDRAESPEPVDEDDLDDADEEDDLDE